MTTPLPSQTRPWIFGVVAFALVLFGWRWLAFCFTARAGAWWNSVYSFAAIYGVAVLIAIRGIRSWVGIVALIIAAISLGCVSLFIFSG